MRIDLKMPVMAKAVMKRTPDTEHRILVSHSRPTDVEEVSSRETEVAVGSVRLNSGALTDGCLYQLQLHNGRLYRFLGPMDQIVENIRNGSGLLSEAFCTSLPGAFDYVANTNMVFGKKMSLQPISRPVMALYTERLCALSMDGSDSRNKTWPKVTPWNGYDPCNIRTLAQALDAASNIDQDDLDEAFRMHDRQAGKLLVIDDLVWYETKPPCIEVNWRWRMGGMRSETPVTLSYRYMPETLEQQVTSMFFPLHEADRALEFAHSVRDRYRLKCVQELGHDFETNDHPAFSFDPVEDLVHRTGQAITSNVLKHLILKPELQTRRDRGWWGKVRTMYEMDNHILDQRADYSNDLPDIADQFLSMSWNKFMGGLSDMYLPQLREVLPMVVEMIDDMAVSVPYTPGPKGP